MITLKPQNAPIHDQNQAIYFGGFSGGLALYPNQRDSDDGSRDSRGRSESTQVIVTATGKS